MFGIRGSWRGSEVARWCLVTSQNMWGKSGPVDTPTLYTLTCSNNHHPSSPLWRSLLWDLEDSWLSLTKEIWPRGVVRCWRRRRWPPLLSPADHLAVRIISGLADQLCLQLEIFLLGENGVFVNINIALASPDDVGYWVSAVRTPDWALYVNHRVRGMWIRALYVINRFPQEPPLMSAANNLWEVLDMSLARGCRIVYLISQTFTTSRP